MKIAGSLPDGVILIPRAKEERVSEIEPKIRQVKERVRGTCSVMPYALSRVRDALLAGVLRRLSSQLGVYYCRLGEDQR